MGNGYSYHRRDISWLSFNHRVLMEAADERLPLYERIKFMAIYSSNLEEFYQVRIAMHRAIAAGGKSEDYTREESEEILQKLTSLLEKQAIERRRIYHQQLIPALLRHNIVLYQNPQSLAEDHAEYATTFFFEEIFPFLQPVRLEPGEIRYFLRDKRLYMIIRAIRHADNSTHHFMLKLPYSKVARFVHFPKKADKHCLGYVEDIIKANAFHLLPGYDIEGCYCCRISRDADIYVDDLPTEEIMEAFPRQIKKRKIGAVARFVYEKGTPKSILEVLINFFHIREEDLFEGDIHLRLEDLATLPNPTEENLTVKPYQAIRLKGLDNKKNFMFTHIAKRDLLLHYPYHSFDHFLHFLQEAAQDPRTKEIMITQYRVAAHSEVIDTLISAARNGKKVTVFVELKARFDESNNWETAELMRKAGVHILFSIPGLKVHAKVALVIRRNKNGRMLRSYACVSTGNFNENTATVYADTALFTCRQAIVNDIYRLFRHLRGELPEPYFRNILVARFNLLDKLHTLIKQEIRNAQAGKPARIILKMNALQDKEMIKMLYRASEAGVKVDLIVRGVCSLIPQQSFSQNIRVIRIVDSLLEHARIWYFENDGKPLLYLGSPDWMRRNLYRRIEAVTPVEDETARRELIDMLEMQLYSNYKTVWLDAELNNHLITMNAPVIRAQAAWYERLKQA